MPPALPRPWSLRVGAGPEVSFGGLVPGVGLGGAASLTVQWKSVSVDGEFRGLWSVEPDREQGLRGSFIGGAVVGCAHPGPFRPFCACLPLHLGWLDRQTYQQSPGAFSAFPLELAFGVRLGLEQPLGSSVVLRAFGEIDGAVSGRTKVVEDRDGESRSRVAAGAILGVSLSMRLHLNGHADR